MKLRTAKKLLKLYRPIIEVNLPSTTDMREVHETRVALQKRFGEKFDFIVFNNFCESPIGILKSEPLPDKERFRLIESIKNLPKNFVSLKNEEIEFIHLFSPVKLHCVLKVGESLYRKKLKQIEELIKKYQNGKQD